MPISKQPTTPKGSSLPPLSLQRSLAYKPAETALEWVRKDQWSGLTPAGLVGCGVIDTLGNNTRTPFYTSEECSAVVEILFSASPTGKPTYP